LFADLADTANPLFAKRVKVLDTMAQLKCCILMLEIDCTDLVLEMFNVFFSVVRLRSISTFSLPLLVLSCLIPFLSLLYNWDIDHFAFV
jgi:sister-chromatid-cohesion protein PDS5